MSEIVFDNEPEGIPYDRDEHLTSWRLVGSATYPTAVSGYRFLSRTFDGTSGYEASDLDSVLLGIEPITWRFLIRPDFDALASSTCTLMSRGTNGPTAGEYWAWDVRLTVDVGATQGTLTLAWQDETGAVVAHDLATFDRPSAGSSTLLAVTREPVESGTYLRASLNGQDLGQLAVSDQITATPAEVVTLGCRNDGGSYDQFYIGDIELAFIDTEASTPLQERHVFHALLVHPIEDRETLRQYWQGLAEVISVRDSTYDKYRLRPLADMIASVSSAIEERTEARLPGTAYGPMLEQWETALGLTTAHNLSIAERQALTRAALAKIEGTSLTFLDGFMRDLLRVDDRLEAFRLYVGHEFDYLWLGTDTDLVAGTVLTPAGIAYAQENTPGTALSCPWGRDSLALGLGLDNTWTLPNATIGNVTSADPVVIVLGYTLRYFPAGAFSLLAGNRETVALNGWEIVVTDTGEIRMLLDDGANQTALDLGSASVGLDVPHVGLIAFDGSNLTAATELASDTGAFAFDPTSATPAALGSYRATTPELTCNWDALLFGISRDAATVAAAIAAPQDFCALIHSALVNGV